MLVCVVLLLIVLSFLLHAQAQVIPSSWPDAFSINFRSNITTSEVSPVPISGKMYYDWSIKTQRIEHGPGSYECVNFYNSSEACTLLFTPAGLYRILTAPLPPGQEECCLDMDSIHASPPNWASAQNPTYNGQIKDVFSGFRSNKWTFDTYDPKPENPHMYYEVVYSAENEVNWFQGMPLIFTFPGNNGVQDYHYDPLTLRQGPQDPALFVLPSGCALKYCSASSRRRTFQSADH